MAHHLCKVGDLEAIILGHKLKCTKGIGHSINNQQGDLRDFNFFGRELEYTVRHKSKAYPMAYPIAFQLYRNVKDHYRIFLFGKGDKMLTSVNLTTGQEKEIIRFSIQIKVISPQSLSKLERERRREEIVRDIRDCGIAVDEKNVVELGQYSIAEDKFLNVSAEQFLRNFLVVGICKNKGVFGF